MLETQKPLYGFQLSNCWDNVVLLTTQDLAATAQTPGRRGHPGGTHAALRGQAACSGASLTARPSWPLLTAVHKRVCHTNQ